MPVNITEVSGILKKAGTHNIRVVPAPGQGIDGLQQIEIREGSNWTSVVTGLTKTMAEGLIKEATNRVLCG